MIQQNSAECLAEAALTVEAVRAADSDRIIGRRWQEPAIDALGELFRLSGDIFRTLAKTDVTAPLVEAPIELLVEHSTLARYVIDVCNSGHRPDPNSPSFATSTFFLACSEAELNFVKAIKDTAARHTVYLDDDNSPVLFQKSRAFGEGTALSVRPLSLNGINHMPGVIFSMGQTFDDPLVETPNLRIHRADETGIIHMNPVRPSVFALCPEEKLHAAAQIYKDNTYPFNEATRQLLASIDMTKLTHEVDEKTQQALSLANC